jgi:hypothetical protein
MILKENKNGLKGQHILAQGNPGKTGRRPGFENGQESRPRDDVRKRENLISDEMEKAYFLKFMDLCFVPIRSLNSLPAAGRRPKLWYRTDQLFRADGFLFNHFTPGVAWG